MAEFSQLYTGRGTAVKLPSGQQFQQAGERLSDFVTRAEEIKYKVFKENEQEFLKNSSITPEFVLADSARKNTAKLIDEYNKKWAKVFQQKASTGGLTMEDKQQMATEKNWIISQNQSDGAAMARWSQMAQAVRSNPGKFDDAEFNTMTNEYMKTGKFDYTTPPIKAKNVTEFLRSVSNDWTNEVNLGLIEQQGRDGRWYKATRTANMTEEQLPDFIKRNILSDPGAVKGLIADFDRVNPSIEAKNKWLTDTDKSGTIDAAERENGILNWAVDYYGKQGIIKESTSTLSTIASGTRSGNYTFVDVAGGQAKVAPGTKRTTPVSYGGVTYTNSYAFGGIPLKNVPTANGTEISGYGNFDLTQGNISAELLEYIPKEDKVIVRVTGGGENPDVASRTLLKLPANNIEGLDNLPIRQGKQDLSLKVIREQSPPPSQGSAISNVQSVFGSKGNISPVTPTPQSAISIPQQQSTPSGQRGMVKDNPIVVDDKLDFIDIKATNYYSIDGEVVSGSEIMKKALIPKQGSVLANWRKAKDPKTYSQGW